MTGLTKAQRIERAKRKKENERKAQKEVIFGGLAQLSTRDVRVIPPHREKKANE